MKKQITVLGSTGSIGTQSLDIVREQKYEVFGLAAHSNIALLRQQIEEFHPKAVAVTNEAAANDLREELTRTAAYTPTVLSGEKGLEELASIEGADILLNAVVGIAGLKPTIAAVSSGKDIALANKESLVTGGKLVMDAVYEKGVHLFPVDSEHSAIFQCLQDEKSAKFLKKIYLTASGGPFFEYTKEMLKTVKKKDALKHPNWEMGAKITIDSATMMNKGLEFIEAMWLFGLSPSQIDILVHRQSIIHSMVEFDDNAVLAQLGTPDMHIPIQYALMWPNRYPTQSTPIDFIKASPLTFAKVDEDVFECLAACMEAVKKGGLYPCVVNGANEAAVALFLEERISFLDIGRLVMGAVNNLDLSNFDYNIDTIFDADRLSREYVQKQCEQ